MLSNHFYSSNFICSLITFEIGIFYRRMGSPNRKATIYHYQFNSKGKSIFVEIPNVRSSCASFRQFIFSLKWCANVNGFEKVSQNDNLNEFWVLYDVVQLFLSTVFVYFIFIKFQFYETFEKPFWVSFNSCLQLKG